MSDRRRGPRPRQREHFEQAVVVSWLRAMGILCCAIPNAARRSPALAAMLKAQGMSAGAPDLLIFTRPPLRPDARGVAIEMKAGKGKATDMQTAWLLALREQGWVAEVCNGASEALELLASLGYRVPR
jgi:hypothetical protein